MAKAKNDLCGKCKKFRVSNVKYQLCILCNFERLHNGLSIQEYRKLNIKENKLKKAKTMEFTLLKDPLLNQEGSCSIDGCLNSLYTKKDGGFCQYHWKIKKANEKIKDGKIPKYPNIKPVSDKKREGETELSKIKKEEKEKHINNNGSVCEGCNKHASFLDYSHILSVKQREDLKLDRDNKNLFCRTCHEDWESWNPKKMFALICIWENLKYIRKNDSETYFKIYFKCIDNGMMKEAQQMDKIDEEFKQNL
jgi:hypothetical protein